MGYSLIQRRYVRMVHQVLYGLRNQYGSRIAVYQLIDAETNYTTGVKTILKTSHEVIAAVTPTKIAREVLQSISQISANKTMVYGGTFDSGLKTFAIEGRHLPDNFNFDMDDWIVYNNQRFEIKSVEKLDYNAGWVIVGKVIIGQHAEQIFHEHVSNRLCELDSYVEVVPSMENTLNLNQEVSVQKVMYRDAVSTLSLTDDAVAQKVMYRSASSIISIADSVTVPDDWSKYKEAWDDLIAGDGANFNDNTPTLGNLSGESKWIGGVIAPNGMVYGIPYHSTSVLKIDPTDDSITTFGNLSESWAGGVLAPNGMIYGIPFGSTSVLKIDPTNDSVTTFGNLLPSDGKWTGGILASNRMIYGIPYDSTSILKIDPNNDSITTFGNLPPDSKWIGGVIAPNGMIYGIPYGSTSVLKINPNNDSITTFGNLPGDAKWAGGVIAPNGMIYGIPYKSTSVLKINPTDDSVTTFGSFPYGWGFNWYGGVLAPNGMIYSIPFFSTEILKIDPTNDSVSTFGNFAFLEIKWAGGILAPNGMIYGIPTNSTSVLKINDNPITVPLDLCLARFWNKL